MKNKCDNCGANLKNNKCEYCKTEYKVEREEIKISMQSGGIYKNKILLANKCSFEKIANCELIGNMNRVDLLIDSTVKGNKNTIMKSINSTMSGSKNVIIWKEE